MSDPPSDPSRRRPEASLGSAVAVEMIDALDEAVLLFDDRGGVVHKNRVARAIADDGERMRAARGLATEAVERARACERDVFDQGRFRVEARPLDGGRALVVVRDVGRDRDREFVLLQSERLASIGLLSAGIGHEINNPAAFVLANLQVLGEQLDVLAKAAFDDVVPLPIAVDEFVGEVKPLLEDCVVGMIRVNSIARDLRAFARADDGPRSEVDLRVAVDSALTMLRNELRYRAKIEKRFNATRIVVGYGARLAQVFLNLVLNAAQAFDEQTAARNKIVIETYDRGERVVIAVKDNGPGIAPEVLPKIFEPLFTTKPSGIGTGLGLPISREIVRGMGGDIEVESELGQGTTFRIELPAAPRLSITPASGGAVIKPPVAVAQRRARVLAIDDEALLLTAYKRMMKKTHDVVTTSGGREALALLAGDSDFDVVLCDLFMPEVSGIDVYRACERSFPHLARRFVFLTGGAFTPGARAFLEEAACPFLDKPVDLETLSKTIDQTVSRRSS